MAVPGLDMDDDASSMPPGLDGGFTGGSSMIPGLEGSAVIGENQGRVENSSGPMANSDSAAYVMPAGVNSYGAPPGMDHGASTA